MSIANFWPSYKIMSEVVTSPEIHTCEHTYMISGVLHEFKSSTCQTGLCNSKSMKSFYRDLML